MTKRINSTNSQTTVRIHSLPPPSNKIIKREGERTQPGYELNQGINLTRHQLNQGTNSTKERTQPGYELNQSGNKLNQYKI